MSKATEELEIFILTYNRADMLKLAIQSCLQQTVKGISITILDNASTDHTADIVSAFDEPNVHLITSEVNIGGLRNMQRCQELCSKNYVMMFHDDDQLHPTYVENAYAHLEANPDTNVIVSNSITIPAQSTPDFSDTPSQSALKIDKIHFAAAFYVRNKISLCSAIYRKSSLKSLNFDYLNTKFGKWGDRPIMIESVENGSAIILIGTYIFTGRHDAQETHLEQTQPPHTAWLHRENYFRDILGDELSSFPGLCFCVMNHRRLKSGYKRRIKKGVAFSTYLDDAFTLGAATKRTWNFRWFAPRPVQRMVDFYSTRHLAKHFSIMPEKLR